MELSPWQFGSAHLPMFGSPSAAKRQPKRAASAAALMAKGHLSGGVDLGVTSGDPTWGTEVTLSVSRSGVSPSALPL